MSKIRVQLSWFELAMASEVGRLRRLASIKRGHQHRHGASGAGWTECIEGACGEMAFSKAMNWYWDGSVNTYKRQDVGGCQVRTLSQDWYDLIVREDDADDEPFVLVTGIAPNYLVHGWILGRDARTQEWFRSPNDRPPAWFVPQAALRPMAELPGQAVLTGAVA